MTLWFVFALMTAAAVFAVLWPLGRHTHRAGGSEIVVYRDQLAEVDRDRQLDRIGPREAEAARIEISRRLLAAADSPRAAAKPGAKAPAWVRRAAAVVALVALPAGAVALYLHIGSPDLPSQPLADRFDNTPQHRSIAAMVEEVQKHLQTHPDDGRGWEVLAPIYLRLGRYDEAVRARQKALDLLGETAQRQADLGEALVAQAQGIVTVDAGKAFKRAAALDPHNLKARFYLGLGAEQDGRPAEAAKVWRSLLAEAPKDAPWAKFVRAALERVDPGARTASAAPAAGSPGPTAAQVQAAAAMTPAQRQAMIHGMVARLAQRLKADGSDLDGWLRLIRAYMVLGERDKARSAAADARKAFAGDPDKLRQINDAAKGLGRDG